MSADLPTDLRKPWTIQEYMTALMLDAADEIERLREALQRIADTPAHHAGQSPNEYHFQEIARNALRRKIPRGGSPCGCGKGAITHTVEDEPICTACGNNWT